MCDKNQAEVRQRWKSFYACVWCMQHELTTEVEMREVLEDMECADGIGDMDIHVEHQRCELELE